MKDERQTTLETFKLVANEIDYNRDHILSILSKIEPLETAQEEVEKTIRALLHYNNEIAAIANRSSFGDVNVALPYNHPLYSLILYCFGPLLGGSAVTVRPSRYTANTISILTSILGAPLKELKLKIFNGNGAQFIEYSISNTDVKSLIFTGSWESLVSIRGDVPPDMRFIYCGSGISPFILGRNNSDIESAIKLLVRSRLHNSGQDCLCSERVYVHEEVAADALTCLTDIVSQVPIGQFGDREAKVCPLIDPVASNARNILREAESNSKCWLKSKVYGNLITPGIYETTILDPVLRKEKYAPIFTVARYRNKQQLRKIAESKYLLSASVVNEEYIQPFALYPHLTTSKTALDIESEDMHKPFGGRMRSGFSQQYDKIRDGPILFSVETTRPAV